MLQSQSTQGQAPSYVLGHSKPELDRLIAQAQLFGDLTDHVLRLAGLERGMRVLDVGCGPGDVTFLAARLVGSEGSVVGVDWSRAAVDVARQRAQSAGLSNVAFHVQDLAELAIDEPVDAIVGRMILMYLGEPAVVLRQLIRLVRPAGIVAFQEIDLEGAKVEPRCATFETALGRIKQTFRRAGIDLRTSLKLGRIFRDAGLPAPEMIQGARVERGAGSGCYAQIAEVTRSLLPLMERTGVATAAEVNVDTLAARIRDEVVAADGSVVTPPLIGAWSRAA